YVNPCIIFDSISEDGFLKSGGYYITGQYADSAGNGLSACFPLIGNIPIFSRSVSESHDMIVGMKSGETTTKAIKILISGADTSFTHLNIISVRITNGVVEAFKVGTVSTSATYYIYNGSGNRE